MWGNNNVYNKSKPLKMVLQNRRKLAKLKSSKEIEKSCHRLKINQFNKKKKPNPMNSENSNAIKDYKSEI